MSSLIAQSFANALIAGAIYALVASGFSLIYSTCKFIHFAHGATVLLGAYFFYFLVISGVNAYLGIVLAIVFSSLFGVAMNALIYERMRVKKAGAAALLIASLVILFFFEAFILAIFGADVKSFRFKWISKVISLPGATITRLHLIIIASSILIFLSLFLFLKKTKQGKAIRAVADNREIAEILGISSKRIYGLSFFIGSALAGVAGILFGLDQNLKPTMGSTLMIKGFTAAVVGGVSSPPGSVLGGFLIGIAENFGVIFLPSGYKDAIGFLTLFIFLIFKPEGILGIKRGEER